MQSLESVTKASHSVATRQQSYFCASLATHWRGPKRKERAAARSLLRILAPLYLDGINTTGSAVFGSTVTELVPDGSTTVSTSRSKPPPATLPDVEP